MRRAAPALLVAAALAAQQPAAASDVDAIRDRLERWVEAFNAGDAGEVCDLFSAGVIAEFRGQPQRDYDGVCRLLQESLADPARDFHYALDLHEIIVEGNLAVVRLTWTLFISPLNVTSVEPGLDVFRREEDGVWRIIRYLAFEEER